MKQQALLKLNARSTIVALLLMRCTPLQVPSRMAGKTHMEYD